MTPSKKQYKQFNSFLSESTTHPFVWYPKTPFYRIRSAEVSFWFVDKPCSPFPSSFAWRNHQYPISYCIICYKRCDLFRSGVQCFYHCILVQRKSTDWSVVPQKDISWGLYFVVFSVSAFRSTSLNSLCRFFFFYNNRFFKRLWRQATPCSFFSWILPTI